MANVKHYVDLGTIFNHVSACDSGRQDIHKIFGKETRILLTKANLEKVPKHYQYTVGYALLGYEVENAVWNKARKSTRSYQSLLWSALKRKLKINDLGEAV